MLAPNCFGEMWPPLHASPPTATTAAQPQSTHQQRTIRVQLSAMVASAHQQPAQPQKPRMACQPPLVVNTATTATATTRRPRRSATAPQRSLKAPHSTPPTQTSAPASIFSSSIAPTAAGKLLSNIYVMINTDDVPKRLESMVDIFYMFDSIRYIVGYCLPLKCFVEYFGNASSCRVIKAIENVELYQEHIHRFKFQIAPLNVVPVNEADFYDMIGSTQAKMENNCGVLRNRFYMRPSILRPPNEVMRSVDSSATQSVVNKFQLNTNPHLIPIRLPDGLECYIRLDLATHCQGSYCSEELEFGYYHFREVQRDANVKLPPPASGDGAALQPSDDVDQPPGHRGPTIQMAGQGGHFTAARHSLAAAARDRQQQHQQQSRAIALLTSGPPPPLGVTPPGGATGPGMTVMAFPSLPPLSVPQLRRKV